MSQHHLFAWKWCIGDVIKLHPISHFLKLEQRNRGNGQGKEIKWKEREKKYMEEGNRAMEGNTKLLRKKEPTKSGKEDTRQISRDQSLELAVQNRAIVKRVVGCLVSLSSLICLLPNSHLWCRSWVSASHCSCWLFCQVAFVRSCQ